MAAKLTTTVYMGVEIAFIPPGVVLSGIIAAGKTYSRSRKTKIKKEIIL
jgi:hypothetical protein